MLRFRLRTLLIAASVLPMLIGGMWWIIQDPAFRGTFTGLIESALNDAPALGKAAIALAIFTAAVVPTACLVCLTAGAFVKNR